MELQELVERIQRWKQRTSMGADEVYEPEQTKGALVKEEVYAAEEEEMFADEEDFVSEERLDEVEETAASEEDAPGGMLDFEEMEVTELSNDDSGIVEIGEDDRSSDR